MDRLKYLFYISFDVIVIYKKNYEVVKLVIDLKL